MIKQLNTLPSGILNLSADQLYTKIDNHTLVHLKGKIERPIFISILQHANSPASAEIAVIASPAVAPMATALPFLKTV